MINGLQNQAYTMKFSAQQEMLGVVFKSNGLKAFMPHHCIEFTDAFVDATDVFGLAFSFVVEQIHETQNVASKFKLLEAYLTARVNESDVPTTLTDILGQLSKPSEQAISIGGVCKNHSVSHKKLIQLFKGHVGLKPTQYLHLSLINQAIESISKNAEQSLTALSQQLNFYDQSHFIRVFKFVTGLKPKQFSQLVKLNQVDPDMPTLVMV